MEKIKISICGRSYNLLADDSPDRIIEVAGRLERQIKEYTTQLKNKSEEEVLTLVALNVLDEAEKSAAGLRLRLEKLETALDEEKKNNNMMMSENISSAESEMEQLARVKDEENTQLRQKLVDYESELERFMADREREIRELKESFNSARSEMEHIATIKDGENTKLRNTLNSYEATFDLYVKVKEEEIVRLTKTLTTVNADCDELRQRLAAVSDDGQLTIC